MTDRIPGAPGRCKAVVTGENLQKLQAGEEFAITLRRDDAPIKEGTPYNKANVLPDELAARLCPEVEDPAPKDALAALQAQKADTGCRKTGSQIILSDAVDAPLMGLRILGRDDGGIGVGDKGDITVNLKGRNLLELNESTFTTTNFITLENPIPAGNYYFSMAEPITTMNGPSCLIGFYTEVGGTQIASFQAGLGKDFGPASLKATQSIGAVYLYAGPSYSDAKGHTATFKNMMISVARTAEFVPYIEPQTLTVPTFGGLLGGDVRDEIDFAKGVLIRRCAEQSETPLPEDVMEAYHRLRTYAPITTITNDESAEMEVSYCTPATAVPMVHSPANQGKFLTIDAGGAVSLEKVAAFVEHRENSDGWQCRVWSDGFTEMYMTDTANAGIYPGSCELNYVLPLPMRSDAMVQVTVPGKVYLSDYSLTGRVDLRLCVEAIDGGTYLQLSSAHIYIAGYLEN